MKVLFALPYRPLGRVGPRATRLAVMPSMSGKQRHLRSFLRPAKRLIVCLSSSTLHSRPTSSSVAAMSIVSRQPKNKSSEIFFVCRRSQSRVLAVRFSWGKLPENAVRFYNELKNTATPFVNIVFRGVTSSEITELPPVQYDQYLMEIHKFRQDRFFSCTHSCCIFSLLFLIFHRQEQRGVGHVIYLY